jgi:GntR family transcriptional regulator / MocR family aminotransferase
MSLRSRQVSDFLPTLERGNGMSLERQLVHAFRQAILDGRLHRGARLPSSRELATSLHINRNTVVAALEVLLAEGYLESVRDSGTFVYDEVQHTKQTKYPVKTARWLSAIPEPAIAPLRTKALEFRVCQPSTSDFPLEAWRKAWREATRKSPPDDYGHVAGEAVFREAIAGYLQRTRGIACTVQDVLVTSGAVQAINLIAQVTLTKKVQVAFEDPGYPLARQVFEQHGIRILPIAVDENGLCVEQLPTRNTPHLVYVTPSHQFPLGGRLSLGRRQALLDWAEQNDALIIEDDYDSEFRFDVPPLPALASLDHAGRVVYVGTFSKVLSPALRVGYVVATPALLEQLLRLKTFSDYYTSSISQLALEHFLCSGALERHIAKMRRIYAHKREVLVKALEPIKSLTRVRGLEAGVNVFLECDPEIDLEKVEELCTKQGVGITNVARYFYRKPNWHGLVLGYGGLEVEQIQLAAKLLVRAVQSAKQI